MLQIDVLMHGPIFDGRAAAAVDTFVDEAVEAVADQAFAEVHRILDHNIKNPTPYYETQIIVENVAEDRVVHDRGIIYGPWLEGVSSRNRETRFKGYAAFRRATQSVERDVPRVIAPALRRLMERAS